MKRATAIGFATQLSGARTVDEVDAVIRSGLAPVVEASGAILGIIDRDARTLRLRLSELIPEAIATRYQQLPVDEAGPFSEVIRTGERLVLTGFADWRAHASPDVVDDAIAAGLVTMVCVPLFDASGDAVAVLAVAWTEEVEVSEAALATIRTVAELCEQTLERAHSTDQATERATRLARLAELLAGAMTVEQALDIIARHGQLPVGAVATSIGLVDEAAGVLRTHHGSSVTDEIRERYADPRLDTPLAFTDAARLNQAVLIGDHQTYIERYPGSAETVAQLGFGARAALPIHAGDGRVIGSMVHAWAGPRTFDQALVSTLTTIAEMAGQAIERARLVEQIKRDSARHEALASMAELLASARTTLEVAQVVAVQAAPVTGADSANLALLDEASGCMQVHHHPSLATEMQARYATLALDAPVPHADALREGEVLVFEDLERFSARYPHLVDDLKLAGRAACALVPLTSTRGDRLGVLGLAWSRPIDLDPTDRSVLVEVGDLCAQAIERATLSDAEHHVVITLQDSVLTTLPQGAGLDVAARYLPAAHHVGLGGDWYQGIALDDDRYAVIVGDVAGHGITAVGDMAQLKAVMGALVRIGLPLGDVFHETTSLLRSGGRAVTATALIAVVDAARGQLLHAAAGHPPALLRLPDGQVRELTDGRQPLLGVVTDAKASAAVQPFPVGSMLVVYTDGLVERRRESLDRSIDRLAAELSAVDGGDAESVASQILAAHTIDRDPDDDIALVVVTRTS